MAEKENKKTSTKKATKVSTTKKTNTKKESKVLDNFDNKISNESNNNKLIGAIVILLLVIVGLLGYILGQKSTETTNSNTNTDIETPTNTEINTDIKVTVIGDERCSDCNTSMILEQIKQAPFLAGASFEEKDFKDNGVEDLLNENGIDKLPAFIFNTKDLNDGGDMSNYLTETNAGNFKLEIGAQFDPYAEICGNGIDDNNNGLIDCADTSCSKELSCAPKVEKPKAELFIMSYCPYGTQAQKGFLEAKLKLDEYADMDIRFVQYLMHGKEEGLQNITQSCIQSEQNDKYNEYQKCFLAGNDSIQSGGRIDYTKAQEHSLACIKEVGIDENKLSTCEANLSEEINFEEKFNDTTKRFPDFDLDRDAALEAGVQGSPTFVLNGIKVENVGRNAKAYADLICDSFENKPDVCNEEFSTATYDPNFGFTSNGQTVEGACGG